MSSSLKWSLRQQSRASGSFLLLHSLCVYCTRIIIGYKRCSNVDIQMELRLVFTSLGHVNLFWLSWVHVQYTRMAVLGFTPYFSSWICLIYIQDSSKDYVLLKMFLHFFHAFLIYLKSIFKNIFLQKNLQLFLFVNETKISIELRLQNRHYSNSSHDMMNWSSRFKCRISY